MKRDMTSIRDRLRADPRCKRLKTLFSDLPIYKIPTDALIKEIEEIHKTRSIRYLTQNSPRFIESIVDASLRDQAERSRCAEISMQCYKAEATLKDSIDKLRDYLLMTYSSELSFVRTKDERTKVINMALAPFISFLDRVALVRNLCATVIDDVDKGAWTLRLMVQAYQLKAGRGEQTI